MDYSIADIDENAPFGHPSSTAVFASTPYQICNALRLASAGMFEPHDSDLFIPLVFDGAQDIVGNIEAENMFNNVIGIPALESYETYPTPVAEFVLSPYERILSAYPHRSLKDMWTFTKGQIGSENMPELVLFDEGIGSYIGNVFVSRGAHDIFPGAKNSTIYLNVPALVLDKAQRQYGEIIELPDMDEDTKRIIERIFSASRNDRQSPSGKTLYMSQPFEKDGCAIELEDEILSVVKKFDGNAIWRPHPRDEKRSTDGFETDERTLPWELICASDNGGIDDDTLLIGAFSTAQFTPILAANKHPYTVFTYRMMFAQWDDAWDELVDRLVDMYERDGYPNRVLVPETLEELESMLRALER